MFVDVLIKYLIAPLVVEVLVRFIDRRAADPVFAAKADGLFARIGSASTLEERRQDAKELQALVHS